MRREELDYPLDPARIATAPAVPRDAARLLVLHRQEDRVEHCLVRDLPRYLRAGDVMVMNTTRVAPMRLQGSRLPDGRTFEGLCTDIRADGQALVLVQGARRFREGDQVELRHVPGMGGGADRTDVVRMVRREGMGWLVSRMEGGSMASAVERCGWTPLPPYILDARTAAEGGFDDEADRAAYQTVYAAATDRPSCAAPTAGLHFTESLIAGVDAAGVRRIGVELQVGPGTFRTVDADDVAAHPMHAERCRVSAVAVRDLSQVHFGQRVIAVGTTSVRVLESLPRPLPPDALARASQGAADGSRVVLDFETDLFIRPGFEFRWTDALMTNFHLPRSTLLALVGALVGMDRLRRLYAEAQSLGYRFYSFGDAMLVLP